MTKGIQTKVVFDLDVDSPSPAVLQWAKDHIGEKDKNIKIYELKEMIYERGDVTPHRYDDAYLLKFLRARHFNLESTYRLLVNYYTFKEDNPNLQENVDPTDIEFIGEEDFIQVLPYRLDDERRVMIIKFGNWNTSHTVEEMFRGTLFTLELGSMEPNAQILGGICIFDFKNFTMSHAVKITPSVASRVLQLMVTSFPLNIHTLHICFQSKVFDMVFKLFQPFLSSRMKNKIFFHGSNMQSLHKHIDPMYLPERYGGVHPNYSYNQWMENLRCNPKIVAELKSLGYNITKNALQKKFLDSCDEGTASDEGTGSDEGTASDEGTGSDEGAAFDSE
ncbi:hypothetical protein RUM44_007001 [Polyplax serrata]|uniref:CRAL-TRIO domain-containing protein n=1 Tax=Polyplax serrata TaxID=468196 RepID=A0ABR1AZJ3_POLSC